MWVCVPCREMCEAGGGLWVCVPCREMCEAGGHVRVGALQGDVEMCEAECVCVIEPWAWPRSRHHRTCTEPYANISTPPMGVCVGTHTHLAHGADMGLCLVYCH